MRVLFTTWAWPSHYFPLVPLAWALRSAGHDVRIASQPALADTIARSGHPAVVVGRDLDMVAYHRRELGPIKVTAKAPDPPSTWDEAKRRRVRQGFRKFAEIADLMADDLVAFARHWRPHLVVHDPMTYAGPLAADLLGVPAVRSLFGPDFNYEIRDLEAEVAAPVAERFGRSAVDPVGTLTIDPVPSGLQFPAPIRRQPVRYVPYTGLGAVPDRTLLEPAPVPRVCLTWGTTTAKFSEAHAERLPFVLDALLGLNVEVLLAVTPDQLDLFPRIPARVRVARSTPLDLLLPGCDAIVHQGGAGTTLTAALHGLPQLVIVHTPDQVVNAIPLAGTGAGGYLVPDETTTEAIRSNVERLLSEPSHRKAGAALRAEMLGRPSPAAAVDVLERLARDAELPPTDHGGDQCPR